jgi:hypothetical protein
MRSRSSASEVPTDPPYALHRLGLPTKPSTRPLWPKTASLLSQTNMAVVPRPRSPRAPSSGLGLQSWVADKMRSVPRCLTGVGRPARHNPPGPTSRPPRVHVGNLTRSNGHCWLSESGAQWDQHRIRSQRFQLRLSCRQFLIWTTPPF